ncbi:hypothetical protein HGA92_05550 [Candidatus Gracilibacteria bacterium]|nr:hypothetical protein [Candidatus Gracilibacteria bacterium]NUJ98662.1 hypothetical protein [Candidatus Gracilibacteria bacterium]
MIFENAYAFDDSASSSILGQSLELGDFILTAISLFVLVSGVFSIIFILRGGLLLILSGGKDDKIKPAINTIRYAIIGIVVTVLTIFFFPILGNLLGLDVEKYAQPKRIFEKIEYIGNKVFGKKNATLSGGSSGTSIDDMPSDFSDL